MKNETYTAKMIAAAEIMIGNIVKTSLTDSCTDITAERIRISNIKSEHHDCEIEFAIRSAAELLGVVYGDGELTIVQHRFDDQDSFAAMLSDPGKEAILKI